MHHVENKAFVSRCINVDADTDGREFHGSETGYRVPTRFFPPVMTRIGRDAGVIWPASSISEVQFLIEINLTSWVIMCYNLG